MPVSPFYGNVDVVGAYEQAKKRNLDRGMAEFGVLQKILAQRALEQRAAQELGLKREALTQQGADRAAMREATAEQRAATLAFQREAAAQRGTEAEANRKARMDELKLRLAETRQGSQERNALMWELSQLRTQRPDVITTDTGMFERTPEGLRPLVDPNTGQQAKPRLGERPITEFQGKNALYGSRAMQAHKTLNDLEEKINVTGLAVKQSMQGTPVIGGLLGAGGNVMLSANQQSVEQAQRNFVNAVLRQESGAVISDPEFENAKKQYFPAPGDSKQVIEQKRKNRLTAIDGFKKIAGHAWKDVEDAGVGVPEFATEAAAAAAGLKPGTRIKIGGKLGTWQ